MKRYLMLLELEGYDYYKSRLYYCASLRGLQYHFERFFNSVFDGYDWQWNDENELEEEEMIYPHDLPLNHWINKRIELLNDFRCFLDGVGIGVNVFSADEEVQLLINDLLNYFEINVNDNNLDEDKQYKAKTIIELLEKDKCKKSITQINKWLA
ncbi:MAG TPA: hypothetical protein P5280_14090 [Cyclobacteriaceae bacterium]|nr:hypothetical protein [Cyclobacteriaceae bacterium]